MRIAVIAPRLTPDYNAEAICTSRVLHELASHGHHLEVITSTICSPLEQHENISVHVVPQYENETGTQRLSRLLNRYPEDGWSWASRCKALANQLGASADIIYTRGMPFSAHLPVYLNRRTKRSGGSTPWLAHFSDPWPQWPESDFGKDSRGWRYKWHRQVSLTPDGFTFPCERVARVCRDEQWADKVETPHFIVNHMGPSSPPCPPTAPTGSPLTIIHTGQFYGARKPGVFLAALEKLATRVPLPSLLKFIHVGPYSEEITALGRTEKFRGIISQTGPLSPQDAAEMQSKAGALLLVENQNTREGIYLPSKLIDYIWVGKPIIALTPENSTTTDILGSDPLRADPWDPHGVTRVLQEALNSPTTLLKAAEKAASQASRFDSQTVLNSLQFALDSTAGGSVMPGLTR